MKAERSFATFLRQLRPVSLRFQSSRTGRRPLSFLARNTPLLAVSQPQFHQIRRLGRFRFTCGARHDSSAAVQSPSKSEHGTLAPPPGKPPTYELTFTCKPCQKRSTHSISKQGYHKGTVLITCPGCKNKHVISDHLKIFADQPFTVEDLMRQNGELIKRGHLGEEGDVEFWDDGTQTARTKK